jgi:hypothetical protein
LYLQAVHQIDPKVAWGTGTVAQQATYEGHARRTPTPSLLTLGLFCWWKLLIQIEVQFQNIDPRLSQESQLTMFSVSGHELPQSVLTDSTCLGDT